MSAPTLALLVVTLAGGGLLALVRRPPRAPWGGPVRVIALALLLALLAYVIVNPLLALMALIGTLGVGFLIVPLVRTGRLQLSVLVPIAGQAAAPLVLFLVLNFMRPDLMQQMLDHVFGYVAVLVVQALVAGGAAAVLLVTLRTKSPAAWAGVWAGSVLLCTFPAIFIVLFGPIIFAFMFGNVATS